MFEFSFYNVAQHIFRKGYEAIEQEKGYDLREWIIAFHEQNPIPIYVIRFKRAHFAHRGRFFVVN